MGHFDILLLQTLQNLVETALEAGAGDRFAGPGPLPGAPRRPLHLLLVDTLGEGLHHGLQLVEGGGPALPHLLHGHTQEPEVQAAQVGGLGRLLVAPGAGGAILSRDSETSNFLNFVTCFMAKNSNVPTVYTQIWERKHQNIQKCHQKTKITFDSCSETPCRA